MRGGVPSVRTLLDRLQASLARRGVANAAFSVDQSTTASGAMMIANRSKAFSTIAEEFERAAADSNYGCRVEHASHNARSYTLRNGPYGVLNARVTYDGGRFRVAIDRRGHHLS